LLEDLGILEKYHMLSHLRQLNCFALTVFFALILFPLSGNCLGLSRVLAQKPVLQTQKVNLEWQQFSSLEGGFSVLMPGSPEEFVTQNSFRVFRVTLQNPQIVFVVDYNLVNVVLTNPSDPSRINTQPSPKFFQGFREGVVGEGRLIRERDVEINSYSGREIEYQDSDALFHRLRLYYVNQRFYKLEAISRTEAAFGSESDRFFNSFRLL
jgi:hypothetical protein